MRRDGVCGGAPCRLTPPQSAARTSPATPAAAEETTEPDAPPPQPAATTRRPAKASADRAPKPAPLPIRTDEKAEAFECFAAGMTVRDVAAEMGLPLSTLSNWQAEWRLKRKEAAA
ncbi:helix-turn-helix domain-containing protein [Neoroseomonas alkaliterrae]|uniref:helix-turn-helix domain-containing protein n=1 Tax=Neoroseomonas alkaliterrae TaxID=1452450 RepID=UPI0030B9BA85